MRWTLIGLLSLSVGCDDAARSGAEDAALQLRDALADFGRRPADAALPDAESDQGRAPPPDAAADARPDPLPPDAAPDAAAPDPACLTAHGIVEVAADRAVFATDAAGRARLYEPSRGGYWEIEVADQVGAPLAAAPGVLVLGRARWSLLLRPPGRAPVFLTGEHKPQVVRASALDQFLGGVDTAAVEEVPPAGGPDCLRPRFAVGVESAHLPLAGVYPRYAVLDWPERCAAAPPDLAPSCALVALLPRDVDAAAPPQILLTAGAPTWGEVGPVLPVAGLEQALTEGTCAGPLDVRHLAWLSPPPGAHAPVLRFRAIRVRYDRLLERLSSEPPANAPAASADLRPALGALARVGALLRPGTHDLYAGNDAETLTTFSSFGGAARAVKALARAHGLEGVLRFDPPYDALLLTAAPEPAFEGAALRISTTSAAAAGLGDGLDCALAAVAAFAAGPDPVDIERGIGHMLDVLEAVAAELEATHWPPAPDAGLTDAGVPDAAPPEPDAAPREPDAGALPACPGDPYEPNQSWQPVVTDARRLPRGGAALDLTLPPGDEDWFSFNVNAINLNIAVQVTPSAVCEWVDQEVCVDLQWYSWVNAEELVDNQPQPLRGPVCAPLSNGVSIGPLAAGALAGEPWASVVVRVFRRNGPGPGPAGYHLRFTH